MYLSIKEAAKRAGCSTQSAREWVRSGRWGGRRVSKGKSGREVWVVDSNSVRDYKDRKSSIKKKFSIKEVAEIADVHVRTARRWARNYLDSVMFNGMYYIEPSSLYEFLDTGRDCENCKRLKKENELLKKKNVELADRLNNITIIKLIRSKLNV